MSDLHRSFPGEEEGKQQGQQRLIFLSRRREWRRNNVHMGEASSVISL